MIELILKERRIRLSNNIKNNRLLRLKSIAIEVEQDLKIFSKTKFCYWSYKKSKSKSYFELLLK